MGFYRQGAKGVVCLGFGVSLALGALGCASQQGAANGAEHGPPKGEVHHEAVATGEQTEMPPMPNRPTETESPVAPTLGVLRPDGERGRKDAPREEAKASQPAQGAVSGRHARPQRRPASQSVGSVGRAAGMEMELLDQAISGYELRAGTGGLASKRAGSSPLGVAASPYAAAPEADEGWNREGYEHAREAAFELVTDHALSTFSVDVDTASYANARRFLEQGVLPPADAVRLEEFVNYFDYGYAPPANGEPFAVHTELTECPWAPDHQLLRIGIQGQEISRQGTPPRNLVFLVDVSGSMQSADKLPLVKAGLTMLASDLRAEDRVAIVVYAGAAGAVLPPTPGHQRNKILAAIRSLEAGGSTNGGAGIHLAYDLARRSFLRGGVNRVILATDGDFNVGTTSHGDLVRLIEEKRKSGVYLSVLGVGRGNLQDHTMESLADNGNGNYAYLDSGREAERVLVREASGTLVTIAKDVKLQVEFNPARVAEYRLVGYENRRLADHEFNDDKRDAGDIGAGHNVTALYELVPAGASTRGRPAVDPLRYQAERAPSPGADASEVATVKVRYKRPDGDTSKLLTHVVGGDPHPIAAATSATRFAAAAAMAAMSLRQSPLRGTATLGAARALAGTALGHDPEGDRAEFLVLLRRAEELMPTPKPVAVVAPKRPSAVIAK